ncbi:MAG: cysteine desulfurase family protein, partial [Myxococcota bacterium]
AVVGAQPREIIFTSGATESNNLALIGSVGAAFVSPPGGARSHVITVETEHRAVLDPCAWLEARGLEVTRLPVDSDGLVDPEAVRAAIHDRTRLVSVMAANNEIGVLQPIEEIGGVCREAGVWFHSDAAQAVGKIPVDVNSLQVDLLSMSFHKMYGPKGIGALYVRARNPRVRLEPLMHGGGHEQGLRSGTLPVALIAGAATALDLCAAELEHEAKRQRELRDQLWKRLSGDLDGVTANGHAERRLPGSLNVSFSGVDGDALLSDLEDIAVSSGSACTSAEPEPSYVLAALGVPAARARASLRFGLGRGTQAEDIERAADCVVAAVRRLRGESRAAKKGQRE